MLAYSHHQGLREWSVLENSLDDAPSLTRQTNDSLGWSLSLPYLPKHLNKTLISAHLRACFYYS